jgi:hypothetical protein
MNAALFAIGVSVFAGALVLSFAGNRVRGRIAGLSGMAAGALLVLVTADPGHPATWWMAITGGLTLAGLVAFAVVLSRWAGERDGDRPRLDDEAG